MVARVLDACLVALAVYLVGRLVWRRKTPLPPGPSGWPLVGNVLDFPIHVPYKTFGAMSKKYGKSMYASDTVYISLTLCQAISYPSK